MKKWEQQIDHHLNKRETKSHVNSGALLDAENSRYEGGFEKILSNLFDGKIKFHPKIHGKKPDFLYEDLNCKILIDLVTIHLDEDNRNKIESDKSCVKIYCPKDRTLQAIDHLNNKFNKYKFLLDKEYKLVFIVNFSFNVGADDIDLKNLSQKINELSWTNKVEAIYVCDDYIYMGSVGESPIDEIKNITRQSVLKIVSK